MEDTQSQPGKSGTIVHSPYFWVVTVLMVILAASYYADHFDLSWIPFGQRFFTSEYVHDLHHALFLIPMLYSKRISSFLPQRWRTCLRERLLMVFRGHDGSLPGAGDR